MSAHGDLPEFLTAEQLAKAMHVSVGHIRNLCSQNKLPFRSITLGRARRFPKHEVIAWLERELR